MEAPRRGSLPMLIGALSVLMAGCAAGRSEHAVRSLPVRPASGDTTNTVVLTTAGFEGSHTTLKMLHVSGSSREGYQRLNEKLREEARQVSADAVIFVRYGVENLASVTPLSPAVPHEVLTARGIAVRAKPRAQ